MFVGIAISPGITAVDNDTDDVDDESRDSEIGASDDYEEIITHIESNAELNWIKRKGFYRGEVEIIRGDFGIIHLWGIRRSNGGSEKFFEGEAVYVYAPFFIGFSTMSPIFEPYTRGLAFGNIEWY